MLEQFAGNNSIPTDAATNYALSAGELDRLEAEDFNSEQVASPNGSSLSIWLAGQTAAFLVSLLFHTVLVLSLAIVPVFVAAPSVFEFRTPSAQEDQEFTLIEEVAISAEPSTEVGANSGNDAGMALSMAPVLADLSEIPSPSFEPPAINATLDLSNQIERAMGLVRSNTVVKGMTGVGTTGTDGAVDRITYEILRSMEDRPTLVVWFFDQSGSLQKRREEIRNRFDRIYEELGIVERSREQTRPRDAANQPLLTSVFAFGSEVKLVTPQPTADIDEIRNAIDSINQDDTGIERVFTALYKGVDKFKTYRSSRSNREERNVLFIAVTDERGDDDNGLDATIDQCRKFAIPVYVIGVPAPFGRDVTYVKYVDPDPKFDQTPQWAQVDQGPESILPERVRLGYKEEFFKEPVIDSGFGPYALSRLCYETGGIYFTVHPNRHVGRRLRGNEIDSFASKLEYFFEPEVMTRYRPDYVSKTDYLKRIESSPLRQTLMNAANLPRVDTLQNPQMRFIKTNDAALANALTLAQQQSARLDPELSRMSEFLKLGEKHRDKEVSPRWLAGFDLALGTVLSHKVRAEGYNKMLAKLKRGMNFEDLKNNTWVLQPTNEISGDSRLEKDAEEAQRLLQTVAEQHRGTPWGLLATEELQNPPGWKWIETFTDLSPNREGNRPNANNNPRLPQDDQARMLAPPPPKRPIPKL